MEQKPYICSMRPYSEPPDNDCPRDFMPYRKICILPVTEEYDYDTAVVNDLNSVIFDYGRH